MAISDRDVLRRKDMSKFIGQKCVVCETKITEENDAHFLEEVLGLETYRKLEHYQKPLCVDCKQEMLYGGIIEVI